MKSTITALNRIVLSLLFFTSISFAQETGKVDYPDLGISFHVPEGWVGKKAASGFFMTSTTTMGFVLVLSHQVQSLSEMEEEAKNGFKIGIGTHLKPINGVEKIMDNTIAGIYTGTIDTKPAKALIVGMMNPYGNGLTILSAANANEYSDVLKNVGLMVTASVTFYKPKSATRPVQEVPTGATSAWTDKLNDSRLTYMSTYATNGGGSSSKRVIDLCGKGYFNFSSSHSMALDTGGTYGSTSNGNQGTGTWKVIKKQKQYVLQLQFYNGKIYEYGITIDEDDKTFLNNERYFRTYKGSGKYSPQCD